ncbi:MAG: phosphomannomutase/phosphoglucomutase [Candidatus Altiarchaeales archaeon]|nr:phosphomannomutase/phosphoglucomutase [Candidatus Altiarchaeales archaeon]
MTIFRAYDIRGVYGKDFTDQLAYDIGRAFGSTASGTVVVGRDMRLSGEKLACKLIAGLLSTGVDVVDIGVVPTPLVYFAANFFRYGNGIMVTASHNPPEYNGFKFIRDYMTLHGEEILELKNIIDNKKFRKGSGRLGKKDVSQDYINFVLKHVSLGRKLKVVLDSGNGMGGMLAPKLLRELGCEVIELYSRLDGNFPNHHPDPTVDKNLADLIKEVKKWKADFGVGFDGDADRAGFIDNQGRIVRGDQALILFAREILKKEKKAKVIYEVKCSRALEEEIKKNGGVPIMYRTGHSYIKQKIKEENAVLAGEMSGHFYFADNYGYDDAIYATARMAELLSKNSRKMSDLMDNMPKYHSTPEIRVECPDEKKFQVVEKVTKQLQQKKLKVITIDGARIQFKDGWGLIRASNTQPALILRMESKTKKGLDKIRKTIETELKKHL